MGNFQFGRPPIPPGTMVKIVQDKFTTENEIPNDIMKTGTIAKVMYSENMLQSRPNARPISITRVKFADNSEEVYLTNNIAPK
jgi:hypothetical protein